MPISSSWRCSKKTSLDANIWTVSFRVLHNARYRIFLHLNNAFTVDHNRYFVNGEISFFFLSLFLCLDRQLSLRPQHAPHQAYRLSIIRPSQCKSLSKLRNVPYEVSYFRPVLTKIEMFRQSVAQTPYKVFHDSPFGGSRTAPYEWTDGEQTWRG